jgi:NAD(P)-dependent dehydrogenase (short-subunit alcohol dehydrogenase family)
VHADLNGAAASRTLAQEAAGLLGGRIDILVNNAGIFPGTSTLTTDEETFDRVYAVNVKSPFFLTQALVPAMIRDGGGTIINLGSWIARLAVPTGALYSSTKGAVETMTRAWAAEFGPHGIRVNAISPGVIQPEGWDPAAEYPGAVFMRSAPAGAPGHPDAIAAAAVYLASDQAAFVHGAVLDIDGGRVNVLTSSARSGEAELAG